MINAHGGPLASRLRGVVVGRDGGEPSDDELLGRYVRSGDAEAFAHLVRRHGAMVWGVCRRLLSDYHTAEDAFQATFLVLVARASAVAPRDRVANWLHGVAYNTALKARARETRRRTRERLSAAPAEPIAPAVHDSSDLRSALDRELSGLPVRYREAILLCDLEGRTHAEAARQLGCPEGTVAARLSRGRAMLAGRLSRRGITLSASALAIELAAGTAAGAIPPRLVRRTVDTAELVAAGGAVPPHVAALTHGGFKVMLLEKWKVALVGSALLVALAVAGATERPGPSVVSRAGAGRIAARPAPVPVAPPREEQLLVTSSRAADGVAEVFKPDGTPARRLSMGELGHVWRPRYSPDGTRLAVTKVGPFVPNSGPWASIDLHVFDPASKDGPGEPLISGMRCMFFAWHPDGTKLYVSHLPPDVKDVAADKPAPVATWVYDLKTKKKAPLELPAGYGVVDVSRDGKTLLAVTMTLNDVYPSRTYLIPVATLKPQLLTEKRFDGQRLSPDGKSVLGVRVEKDLVPLTRSLTVVAVADGSERTVKLPAGADRVYQACWSPNGRRIAFHWCEEVPVDPNQPPAVEGGKGWADRVTVADPDGANPKTILTSDGKRTVSGLDWR
ncbi:RNA polymerase sigma factor [Gemmata sp. JC673]|uniref:RNA polymerase sigma factor n=1 Tax=Gemmata algarum TaxID=2975278 RepID=A0ABU5F3T4_9BACT|nr:RNA polymerase sigma factor [Gemmata algarum]MDY3560576.1 RNA polymerase sigma factor [Gemmata algarum]